VSFDSFAEKGVMINLVESSLVAGEEGAGRSSAKTSPKANANFWQID